MPPFRMLSSLIWWLTKFDSNPIATKNGVNVALALFRQSPFLKEKRPVMTCRKRLVLLVWDIEGILLVEWLSDSVRATRQTSSLFTLRTASCEGKKSPRRMSFAWKCSSTHIVTNGDTTAPANAPYSSCFSPSDHALFDNMKMPLMC